MFKQLFATMNDVLDEILREYPAAQDSKKKDFEQQVGVLKSMSDICIEEWLQFEEKLEQAVNVWKMKPQAHTIPEQQHPAHAANPPLSDAFKRGQGYYQLFMYDQAVEHFEQAVAMQPDFQLARLYLALGYMRKGDLPEAYRHFRLLTSLTEHKKVKAISYNAMGCIQAKNKNPEKARQYFELALKADPALTEPLDSTALSMQEEERLLHDSGLIL